MHRQTHIPDANHLNLVNSYRRVMVKMKGIQQNRFTARTHAIRSYINWIRSQRLRDDFLYKAKVVDGDVDGFTMESILCTI